MNFSIDFFNIHFSLWMFLTTELHPQNIPKSVLAFLKEHPEVLVNFFFLLPPSSLFLLLKISLCPSSYSLSLFLSNIFPR